MEVVTMRLPALAPRFRRRALEGLLAMLAGLAAGCGCKEAPCSYVAVASIDGGEGSSVAWRGSQGSLVPAPPDHGHPTSGACYVHLQPLVVYRVEGEPPPVGSADLDTLDWVAAVRCRQGQDTMSMGVRLGDIRSFEVGTRTLVGGGANGLVEPGQSSDTFELTTLRLTVHEVTGAPQGFPEVVSDDFSVSFTIATEPGQTDAHGNRIDVVGEFQVSAERFRAVEDGTCHLESEGCEGGPIEE